MTKMTGGEMIVDFLISRKVPYLFGLCGHGIVGLMDAALERSDEIKMVSVHNEQVAGFMADAFYRVARQPAATFTSCGPGSVNIQMAIATALQDCTPMMAITGNVPTQQFNRMPFQELGQHYQADYVSAMRPYVKRSYQATRPDMLPHMLNHAYRTMTTGVTGPVHLDVPFNVFLEEAGADETTPQPVDGAVIANAGQAPEHAIEAALDLLINARKPLLLAGHGTLISGAGHELAELAEYLQIPVATTPQGKGSIGEYHELALGPTARDGVYAANRASRECDVLLAIGTRFGDRSTSSWEKGVTHDFSHTKLIHIELDAERLGRTFAPTVGIAGDARTVLAQLLAAAQKRKTGKLEGADAWLKKTQSWRQMWFEAIAETDTDDSAPLHPDRILADLRNVAPDNAVMVSDIGAHHSWMVQQFRVGSGQMLLQSGGFATMGFGVCGALGAQVAAPDRPVIAVVGDGGFLMHCHAVATAVEYGLPIVWIVWNNNGYVSIRDIQKGFFGANREYKTMFRDEQTGDLASTDFAMLARSMGADGVRVDRAEDLAGQIETAIKNRRPCVLDVKVRSDVVRRTAGGWNMPPLKGAGPNFDPDPMV